jgi:hypothetical protein
MNIVKPERNQFAVHYLAALRDEYVYIPNTNLGTPLMHTQG